MILSTDQEVIFAMKISLHMPDGDAGPKSRVSQDRVMENEIIACKRGDFEAEKRMLRKFMPLLTSLARKRSQEPPVINMCIEAGKKGLKKAIQKYKPSVGADKFRIFAVEYIEKSIDDSLQEKKGFFARLFG